MWWWRRRAQDTEAVLGDRLVVILLSQQRIN